MAATASVDNVMEGLSPGAPSRSPLATLNTKPENFSKWVAATAKMQFTPMALTPITLGREGLDEAMALSPVSALTALHGMQAVSAAQTPMGAGASRRTPANAQTTPANMSVAYSDVSDAISKLALRDKHQQAGAATPGTEALQPSPQPMAGSPLLITGMAAGQQVPVLRDGVLLMATAERPAARSVVPKTPVEAVLNLMASGSEAEDVQPLQLQFEDAALDGAAAGASLRAHCAGRLAVAESNTAWVQDSESDDEIPLQELMNLTPEAGLESKELLWRAASSTGMTPVAALLEMLASPVRQC